MPRPQHILRLAAFAVLMHSGLLAQVFTPSDAVPPTVDLPVIQRSAAFGDLDNDGDLDLFAPIDQSATLADPLPVLQRNDGSHYTDITLDVGLTVVDAIYTNSAVWLDADRDGWLDLYVGSYWYCCIAGSPAGKPAHPTIRNRLYRNLEGAFLEDVTEPAGLDIRFDLIGGGTQGETGAADLNGDGWPDLYLGAGDTGFNYVFLNDQAGRFWEASGAFISLGVAPHAFDMGDVDNDGDIDIFQTAGVDTTLDVYLFRNVGGQIDDATVGSGLEDLPLTNDTDGGLIDLDADGDLDVLLWGDGGLRLNDGGGLFSRPSSPTTLQPAGFLAFDDADTDGDLDVLTYTAGRHQPDLFLNNTDGGNWLRFELVGTTSNASATGATITVTTDAFVQGREVHASRGVPQPARMTYFGLGSSPIAQKVEVWWPSGLTTVLEDIAANQRLTIVEGAGANTTPLPATTPTITLTSSFPNPFTELISLALQVHAPVHVELEMLNLLGQRIVTIATGELLPGHHRFSWDATDAQGESVAAGLYFVRLAAGASKVDHKVLYLPRRGL